jgi:lipoate synthase
MMWLRLKTLALEVVICTSVEQDSFGCQEVGAAALAANLKEIDNVNPSHKKS